MRLISSLPEQPNLLVIHRTQQYNTGGHGLSKLSSGVGTPFSFGQWEDIRIVFRLGGKAVLLAISSGLVWACFLAPCAEPSMCSRAI